MSDAANPTDQDLATVLDTLAALAPEGRRGDLSAARARLALMMEPATLDACLAILIRQDLVAVYPEDDRAALTYMDDAWAYRQSGMAMHRYYVG